MTWLRRRVLLKVRPYEVLMPGAVVVAADYVAWCNARQLGTSIAGIPPVEYEAAYYALTQLQGLDPTPEASTKRGASGAA